MSDAIFDAIEAQIRAHRVLIYMKGSPFAPYCGFSAKACDVLQKHNLDIGYVDILSHQEIRQWLPEHSGWPTFPQIFIDEELIGGCDILCEIEKTGELAKIIAESKLPQTQKIVDATLENV